MPKYVRMRKMGYLRYDKIYSGNIRLKSPGKWGKNKPHKDFVGMADGEGFEPPVELPPQRFSRPSQSTALPPILNFFYRRSLKPTVLFADRYPTVLLTTRSRSTVLTLVSLTRMQDRRNRPRLSPILNFFIPTVPAKRHERAYYTVLGAGCQFICWGKIIMLANVRLCDIIIPTERANIKGNKTWLNLFW